MQNSSIRLKSESIQLFAKTNSADNTCVVHKLLANGDFVDLNYTPSITQIETDLYSTDITLPNEDCIVCAVFKGEPIVVIVGDPARRFIFYRIDEGITVPYKHYSLDGTSISSGALFELGGGFYAHDIGVSISSIIEVYNIPYRIKLPYTTDTGVGASSGVISIQNNVWQLIAIPRESASVKEYFVDGLASKYSAQPEDMIEICTAYFGNENRFRSYIPGVTNPATSNNFPLIYLDGSSREISGFWVKIKDLTGIVPDINNVTFEWSSV